MKPLQIQVAKFLQDQRLSKDWPFELKSMIFDLNLERIKSLQHELDLARRELHSNEESLAVSWSDIEDDGWDDPDYDHESLDGLESELED